METSSLPSKVLGSLIVIGAVLMSTGCLDRTPDQSGVFTTEDSGGDWRAIPDLTDPEVEEPDTYPPLSVTAVGVNPEVPERVFAGTEDNLYRSTDAGRSWEDITEALPDTDAVAVQEIGTDARIPEAVYVAGVAQGYGKVFRSTDGGRSFEAVFTGSVPRRGATSVAFGPDPNTVYVGDQEGNVYRSRDGGSTWQRIFSTEAAVTVLASSGPHLFAGTFGSGVFHSPDGGNTFTPVNTGLPRGSQTVWDMETGNGGLYLGTDEGLFLTRDFGRSWGGIGNPFPENAGRVQAVAVEGPQVFFASGAVVYRVPPEGERFTPRQLDLVRNVTDLAAVSSERLYAGGHYRDFTAFEQLMPGFPRVNINPQAR
ncbi:MAG: hypothetical protein WD846_00240 [Patescibacteria group bacterium]